MGDNQKRPQFNLALTMAGAISAGAYTAGVIDFLIEALDAWEGAKRKLDHMAPQHSVSLSTISGASAGAITAAMLAACLKFDFPHRRQGDAGDGSANPLYDNWVNQIDIRHLLDRRDLKNGNTAVSLLDSTRLLEIARRAIDYGDGMASKQRPYLSDPLRFIFTITNLRGVPFEVIHTGGGYQHSMTMHGDAMRFALLGLGANGAPAIRANEYPLSYPNRGKKWGGTWEQFAFAALASGAFPVGLAPREVIRRTSDYSSLAVVVPGGPGQSAKIVAIAPKWSKVNPAPQADYQFVSIDGGTIDNEPLELARIELAGGDPLARNVRDGLAADRAVVMIDPFVGPQPAGPSSMDKIGLISCLISTFSSLKNHARFRPQDIALALEDTTYSRYLIAPSRDDKVSEDSATSIACGCLGGFGGFLHVRFREHDFHLGRRNCQRFLTHHLTLPEGNPLFGQWTEVQKQAFAVATRREDGSVIRELPIVPLMPGLNPAAKFNAAAEEKLPAWPKGAFDPASLRKPIDSRLDALFGAVAHETEWNRKLRGLLLALGWRFYLKSKIANQAVNTVRSQMEMHGLV